MPDKRYQRSNVHHHRHNHNQSPPQRLLSILKMRVAYFPTMRRVQIPIALGLILLFLVSFYRYSIPDSFRPIRANHPAASSGSSSSPPAPPLATLPELQAVLTAESAAEPSFCLDRFGPKYLEDLRDGAIQYCSAFSPSASASDPSLTCFHSHTASNADRDSFCVAHGAVLDPSSTATSSRALALPCQIRAPTDEERDRGLIEFSSLKRYWYSTGPANIFDHFFRFDAGAEEQDWYKEALSSSRSSQDDQQEQRPPYVVMIKREGDSNVWHSLMEIWSLTMTLDMLRMSPDPQRRGNAFFEVPGDVAQAQVVILDEHKDGALFSIWKLLTGLEPLRWRDWVAAQREQETESGRPRTHNVIVPLPGASNPQWQNDWTERDCHDGPLLKVFSRRVMAHLGIEPFEAVPKATKRRPAEKEALSLTFLDRKQTRRLVDTAELIAAARRKFPDVSIQVVDFATLPFPEQIRIIRETDVLVGVHGAGLTHLMFLNEGGVPDSVATAAAVVEIMPEGMDYKGFRNMAQMMGHRYFGTHAQVMAKGTADVEEAKKANAATDSQKASASEAAKVDDGETAEGGQNATAAASSSSSTVASETRSSRQIESRGDDWHYADVKIAEAEFLELIGEAIEAIQ